MHKEQSHRQRGFTLLEVLVSTTIFLLILMGIYSVFDTSQATYASGLKKVDVQQNARFAMDEMAKNIRVTGYFPENFVTPLPATLLQDPIRIATNNTLVVYGNLDNDPGNVSSIFLFCFDPAFDPVTGTGAIYRKKNPAANINVAASYRCGSSAGALDTVGDILIAQNIASLQFTYFDANNVAIRSISTTVPYQLDGQAAGAVPDFAASPPAERRLIRTIVITLVAQQNVPNQATQRYTLTSTIRIRNL